MLLFIDGFDHYDDWTLKWDAGGNANKINPTQAEGRFAPGALGIADTGGGGAIVKNLPEVGELHIGFAMLPDAARASRVSLGTKQTSNADAVLLMNPTSGIVSLILPENGTQYDSAPSIITASTWHFLELHYKLGETDGAFEVRHNGVAIIGPITGIDTRWKNGAPTALVDELVVAAAGNNTQWYMDDLYVLDTTGTDNNTFLGDVRVTTLRPKAAGVNTEFTPTGAPENYNAVNETLIDRDATYVEAGVVGAKESYDQDDFDDLGVTPGTIYGVQVTNCIKKTDAGSLRATNDLEVGNQVFQAAGEIEVPSALYKCFTDIWERDPRDNAAWTEAKVEIAGSGFRITFREV